MSLVKIISRAVSVPVQAGMPVVYKGKPAMVNDWTEGSRRVFIRQGGRYIGTTAPEVGLAFR